MPPAWRRFRSESGAVRILFVSSAVVAKRLRSQRGVVYQHIGIVSNKMNAALLGSKALIAIKTKQ